MKNLLYFIIEIISYLVPKNKKLCLFIPVHSRKEFSGNLKSMFLYFEKQNNFKIYWKTESADTYKALKDKGYNVVLKRLKFYYLVFRAAKILMDSGIPWLRGNFDIIQVWHGTGFKNIGLLNPQRTKAELTLFRKHFKCYSIVVANSESDADQKIKSFQNQNVFITGSPRNDIFFSNEVDYNGLKVKYNLYKYAKVFLYAPTFRDSGITRPFQTSFLEKLNAWLNTNNYAFAVKKHPADKNLDLPDFSNIINLSTLSDVEELLMISDVLISDYSSIVSDYVVMDKPVIYYIYDYADYISKSRDMYHDYKKVIPGPFAYNDNELFQLLDDLTWFNEQNYAAAYKVFQDRFNKFKDGKSSERVYNLITSRKNIT